MIENGDMTRLQMFLQKAEELRAIALRIGHAHPKVQFHFGGGVNEPMEVRTDFPDEDMLRSLYMALRVFYMQNEPISFYGICNLLRKYGDEDSKKYIAEIRAYYARKLTSPSGVVWKVNEHVVKPEEFLDLWFNSQYFHVNEEKYQRWVKFTAGGRIPIPQSMLIVTCLSLSRAILRLADEANRTIKRVGGM